MHGKYSELWNTVLLGLKRRVSEDNFELWFSSLKFAGVDEKRKKLVVAAINSFMRDYLDDNFRDMIEREARPVFPGLILK
jgi:chromosomal replication initiation ATPase DnaA